MLHNGGTTLSERKKTVSIETIKKCVDVVIKNNKEVFEKLANY